jgi:hypothetical protein
MSEITLRGNKGSALTYGELDANFATIGLTDGMDTTAGNVAISVDTVTATTGNITTGNITTVNADDIDVSDSILINTTSTEDRPLIVEAKDTLDSVDNIAKFVRHSDEAGAKSAMLAHTEFSIPAAAGMGTGIWNQFSASDTTGNRNLSGMQAALKTWTDEDNYTSAFYVYTFDRASGVTSFNSVFEAGQDEVKFTNTDQVTVDASHLQLKLVDYADLPTLSGSADDGKIAFLREDGAGANQYKLIFSVGGLWKYVDDPATAVATS